MSRFKFKNLGLAVGITLKFNTSVEKGLKLKVRKFWGLSPTLVENTGGKLIKGEGLFAPHPPFHGILNRVNSHCALDMETIKYRLRFD